MQNEVGTVAADGLRSDAQTFRAKVLKDISSLLRISILNAVDLAVFTNALTLENKYLVAQSGTQELRSFKAPLTTNDPVTEYSPLSSRITFRHAIAEALHEYTKEDQIILIVNSHGTREFAVIPRIAADFTELDVKGLQRQLESEQGNDLALRSVELRGITKVDLWKELDSATRTSRVHFSLVFLQACESAASSWNEYFAMPSTVDNVAHTGFDSISPEQFDYALLADSEHLAKADFDEVRSLTNLFRRTGAVYFDSKYTYWRWPLLVTAVSLPKLVYFAPLSLWLLLYFLKSRRGFVTTHPDAAQPPRTTA